MHIVAWPGPLLRLILACVALTVGGGPSIFDGCLVNCHEETHAGTAPDAEHCHAERAVTPAAAAITSTAACDHDHGARWADVRETSAASAAKAVGELPASHPSLAAPVSTRVGRPAFQAAAAVPIPARSVPLRI